MRHLLPALFAIFLATFYDFSSAQSIPEKTKFSSKLSFPLKVDGTNIINKDGEKVRLACFNWPGHMDLMIPEGLSKQSAVSIIATASDLGFNCVRLTFATEMAVSNDTKTVRQRLEELGMAEFIPQILLNNAWVLDSKPIIVFDRIIKLLAFRSKRVNVNIIL